MAVPTTTNLDLAKPDQGTTSWNTYFNQNWTDLDGILGADHDASGNHEVITLDEQSATPSAPTVSAEANLYLKSDKLVIQFDDAGTTKYFYLDLTATSNQQWQYTTSAP